ncbi:hypothetical protein [Streptomyces sp. NRRL B-24572]|uniref:hypothetical protein n=1 Tax=Streptomyces sp. NRRL B-24572 TaxID=1962156 RepID=UPI000A3ABBB4|nr:hypothetical protein [Streptomyces sp. NRRL B-24572]
MSEPNPYADGEYKWGPGQQDATPAYGYPHAPPPYQPTLPGGVPVPPQYPAGFGGVPTLAIGDISVVGDQILTPAGPMPLKGAVWNAMDMSRVEEKIPTVAIVLAVVFAVFCLLGLLFLLMKEKQTTGYVQVTVSSGGRHHSTLIPAGSPDTFYAVMNQINYARTLSI